MTGEMENVIALQVGLGRIVLNVNARKINTAMTVTKHVNVKVRTQNFVIHMMESVNANKVGAAQLAIDLVLS